MLEWSLGQKRAKEPSNSYYYCLLIDIYKIMCMQKFVITNIYLYKKHDNIPFINAAALN